MSVGSSESRWLILSCGSRIDGAPFNAGDFANKLARSLTEARKVVPSERIVLVALESESPWWAPRVVDLSEDNIVEQPIDRGSAIGVLIAFLRIFRRDPCAEVIVASIDAQPGVIATAAAERSDLGGDDRVLVGLRPGGRMAVLRASSAAFLRLFREAKRSLLTSVIDHLREEASSLDEIYPFLPAVDLERDVLGLVPDSLRRATAFA